MVPFGEAALAVGLARLELAQQRGSAPQGAVAFHPGAIQRFPAAGPAGRLDLGKQGGAVLLQPVVERRGGVAKAQGRILGHQLQHRAEGAFRRLPGVGHRPEPGQIQVGVAD